MARKLAFLGGLLLAVLAMAFIGRLAYEALTTPPRSIHLEWWLVVVAGVARTTALLVKPLLWLQLLGFSWTTQGVHLKRNDLYHAYSRSWLAGYLPGRLWAYVGRTVLASKVGVPLNPLGWTMLLEELVSHCIPAFLGLSLVVAMQFHPAFGALGVALGILAMVVALSVPQMLRAALKVTRLPFPRKLELLWASAPAVALHDASRWTVLYALNESLYLLGFVFLISSVFDLTVAQTLTVSGAFAIGASVGSLIAVSPFGFVAKDVTALLLVTRFLGTPESGLIISISRLLTLATDVGFVATAEVVGIASRRMRASEVGRQSLPGKPPGSPQDPRER